jgi:tetraacyldisaccharide 4'-kinase
MRAPAFWQHDGVLAHLLAPAAALYGAATARRLARPGWRAPVPVICCGNATVGGAGKTTLALDLGARLQRRGVAVAFLSRGYGGRVAGPLRVEPARHDAAAVGDEAVLLAAAAPTWIGADRAASARAAVAAGAGALVMDDGLQNPTLHKTLPLLVIDGAGGIGNGRVMPAGPLREPLEAAAARCRAAVLIGQGNEPALPPGLPVLRASLAPPPEAAALAGRAVLAFAGIGRPEKFFNSLEEIGADLVARRAFPDHHTYSARAFAALLEEAARAGAVAVTTPKDAARLAPAQRACVTVIGVRLVWQEEAAIERLLDTA